MRSDFEGKKFYFLQLPLPLHRTKRIGRVAKDVWACVYTYQLHPHKRRLSAKYLAEYAGIERWNLPREIDSLVRNGLLRTWVDKTSRGRFREYEVLWPDWLNAEGKRFVRRDDVSEKDSVQKSALPKDSDTRQGDADRVYQGDSPGVYRGDSLSVYRGDTPYKKVVERGSRENAKTEFSHRGTEDTEGEDEEVRDPNSDSVETNRSLGEKAGLLKERKTKTLRRPRGQFRVFSKEEFADRPSERPEHLEWREKKDSDWKSWDLVGYWLARYREVLGREDPDFVGGTYLSGNYGPRARQNIVAFVSRQLGGSAERWREAVDKVLRVAPSRGFSLPSFAYFFGSPYNGASLASLDRPPRGARKPSPREANDARGVDLAYWEKRAEENLERRRARERGEWGRSAVG